VEKEKGKKLKKERIKEDERSKEISI